MTHRGALLWIAVIAAFGLAIAMLSLKMQFDLGSFLTAIIGLFAVDTAHEHIGGLIDAKYGDDK